MKKSLKQTKVKKVVDKDKMAINKPHKTYPEVLTFMGLEEDSTISRAQLIQGINAFVKKQKAENNPEIFVEGNNKCFNLIGELKELFDFIKNQMINRGDLTDENENSFPSYISYRDIMKYLKYCIVPK